MKGSRWLLLLIALAFAAPTSASDDVKIVVTAVASDGVGGNFGALPKEFLAFPEDVGFVLEPLYPARNNLAQAKIELRYSCVSVSGGGLVVPCHITIDAGVARQDSGGHSHNGGRPTGRHVPSAGWVSETDGYLRSTYYASEVGGVIDVAIQCSTMMSACRGGKVVFGVGVQGLEELGQGIGYVLTGAKPEHPSNHWGVPAFLAAARLVAAQFANDNPDNPLLYNDVSLEHGGVFDVATRNASGYDWSPPHSTHRLGTNMDIGIPRGKSRRALALRLFQMAGVRVLQEDQDHWHLSY